MDRIPIYKVVIDRGKVAYRPNELPYLIGAEIDYTEETEDSQFVIRNPNDDEPPPAVVASLLHRTNPRPNTHQVW